MKQTSLAPEPPRASMERGGFSQHWKVWMRIGVAITVVIALAWAIRHAYFELREQPLKFSEIDWSKLMLAAGIYLGSMTLSWIFWHRILLALGQRPRKLKSLGAFFVSQLGKYVPGKALVVVLRTDLVQDEKVKVAPAAASVFIETLTWLFVGAMIASLLLVFQFENFQGLQIAALAMMLVAGFLTWPPVFNRIASKISKAKTSGVTYSVDFITMATGWALLTVGWCLNGASLLMVIESLPGTEVQLGHFPVVLAAVTLASVGGFVSLLPGGLGVRELVMIPLLGSEFGTAIAVITVILVRFVWLTAEFVSSGIIYLVMQLIHEPNLPRTSDDG
ncbi:flippase-like domain-containing protein [bacterium]|nr:flippase-like domain-containing protein [bacterium]